MRFLCYLVTYSVLICYVFIQWFMMCIANSSKIPYEGVSIRIEGLLDVENNFKSRCIYNVAYICLAHLFAHSLFLWRDEINKMGGICLDKITSKLNTCNEKITVSVVLYKPDDEYCTSSEFVEYTKSFYSEIEKREKSQRPHFLISPKKYDAVMQSIDSLSFYNNKYHYHGLNIPFFLYSPYFENEMNKQYDYIYSPYKSTYDIALNIYNTFTVNEKINRYILIGEEGEDYYFHYLEALKSIIDTHDNVKISISRCKAYRNVALANNCYYSTDCSADYTCQFPILKSRFQSIVQKIEYYREWLSQLENVSNEAVIVFGVSVDTLRIFRGLFPHYNINPKALFTFEIDERMTVPYVHGILPLQNNTHGKSGEYLGTFTDYFYLIYDNIDRIEDNSIDEKEMMLKTKYIPQSIIVASITGITIQRVIELYGQTYRIHADDDELWNKHYWDDSEFINFKNVFHNLGICNNMNFKICSDNSDCASQKCVQWDTFYGSLNYSNRIVNIDERSDRYLNRIVQFKDGGILENNIISPPYDWLKIKNTSLTPSTRGIEVLSAIGIAFLSIIFINSIFRPKENIFRKNNSYLLLLLGGSIIECCGLLCFSFYKDIYYYYVGFVLLQIASVSMLLGLLASKMSELSFKTYYPSTAVNKWLKIVIMLGYLDGILVYVIVDLYNYRNDDSLVFPAFEKAIAISFIIIDVMCLIVSMNNYIRYSVINHYYVYGFSQYFAHMLLLSQNIFPFFYYKSEDVLIAEAYVELVLVAGVISPIIYLFFKYQNPIDYYLKELAEELKQPIISTLFIMYLKKYHYSKYIEFWVDANQFRTIPIDPNDNASIALDHIYQVYFNQDNPDSLQWNSQIIEEIEQYRLTKNPLIFSNAQKQVLLQVERENYWNRFLHSKYASVSIECHYIMSYLLECESLFINGIVQWMAREMHVKDNGRLVTDVHEFELPVVTSRSIFLDRNGSLSRHVSHMVSVSKVQPSYSSSDEQQLQMQFHNSTQNSNRNSTHNSTSMGDI